MAKKKQEDAPAGSPAWMSTFSDLMNLLLCFFVLLFASSTVDAEKLQQISASFSKISIFDGGAMSLTKGTAVNAGISQLTNLDNYVNSCGRNANGQSDNLSEVEDDSEELVDSDVDGKKIKNQVEETDSQDKSDADSDGGSEGQDSSSQSGSSSSDSENNNASADASNASSSQTDTMTAEEVLAAEGVRQSQAMNEEIESMLQSSGIDEQVDLDYNGEYVEIDLNGGVLFNNGGIDLTDDAKKLVDRVGDILEKYRNQLIEIEGHTDNIPYSGQYINNQYLSAARAISVYDYLLEKKNLIAANMKTSGFGDSRPKASNDTAEGRALNRRVVIKIYNNLNSNQ